MLPGHTNNISRRWILSAIILPIFVVSCTTVAITGRKQLNFIPDGELMSMSYQQYDSFLKENRLSTDSEKTAMVKRVGKRIQKSVETYFTQKGLSSELDGYNWEFNLVDNEQVNAWCMPGGKVVFYTGILPLCESELGIAVVMGHEVAHAIARHGAERMSQALMAQGVGLALAVAMKDKPEETKNMWMGAFGAGAQVGVLLPFSRRSESEADHLGLIFMAMAGYNPREAANFWQRMAQAKDGAAPPEFLSTHPSDATRIRQIKDHLPEALGYYKN